MGDAEQLRSMIAQDADHRALYEVFLAVRDAAAKILENTTVADLIENKGRKGSGPKVAAHAVKKKATGV
jgi:DNA-binding IscR family transcriptional regulator